MGRVATNLVLRRGGSETRRVLRGEKNSREKKRNKLGMRGQHSLKGDRQPARNNPKLKGTRMTSNWKKFWVSKSR